MKLTAQRDVYAWMAVGLAVAAAVWMRWGAWYGDDGSGEQGTPLSIRQTDESAGMEGIPTNQGFVSSHAAALINAPSRLRPVLGLDGNGQLNTRIRALESMTGDLRPQEELALYGFLLHRCQGTLTDVQYYVLVNEILDRLVEQPEEPPELAEMLDRLWRDRTQHAVVRDYAVQHMGAFYERTARKEVLRQALWETLEERDGAIAGTGLLALYRIAQGSADIDPAVLNRVAADMVLNPAVGSAARATALRICGMNGATAILPAALRIAQSSGALAERIAAIGVLGDLGGTEARKVLDELQKASNSSLRAAARTSLATLMNTSGVQR